MLERRSWVGGEDMFRLGTENVNCSGWVWRMIRVLITLNPHPGPSHESCIKKPKPQQYFMVQNLGCIVSVLSRKRFNLLSWILIVFCAIIVRNYALYNYYTCVVAIVSDILILNILAHWWEINSIDNAEQLVSLYLCVFASRVVSVCQHYLHHV